MVGTIVAVGGTGVLVGGGSGVAVSVAVGGTGVFVGATVDVSVAVGGTGVLLGATVDVAAAVGATCCVDSAVGDATMTAVGSGVLVAGGAISTNSCTLAPTIVLQSKLMSCRAGVTPVSLVVSVTSYWR